MDSQEAVVGIEVVVIAEESGEKKKKRAKRRYWEHPSNALRNVSGHFKTLYKELRQRPEKFFDYYGMSISTYDELLGAIRNAISKQNTFSRMAITAEERLSVTLRYLTKGTTFSSLKDDFLMGRSTISGIVKETCTAIWKTLLPMEMAKPTEEQWVQISENFYEKTSFPNCLGAVDGKHVRIVTFQNYLLQKRSKNYNSVVLMAVADANYKFTAIDVGLYGGEGEEFSFKDCEFGKSLYKNLLGIPPNKPLPNIEEPVLPHVFLGEDDFPLHENLLKQFPKKQLTDGQRIFNYRFARAHSFIECAFGLLCNKWRILHSGLTVAPEFALLVVQTVCVLHNFVGTRDGFNMEDSFVCHLDDYKIFNSGSTSQGKNVRQTFADYFLTPAGEVSWQYHGLENV